MLTPVQEKLAYCEVMMAGRWLWHHICKKEKGYTVKTNYYASTGQSHDKC
jgi:hypothetical protein